MRIFEFNYLDIVYNREVMYCFIKEVCKIYKYNFDIVETNMFGLVIKGMKEVLGLRRSLNIGSDVYAVIVLDGDKLYIEIYGNDKSIYEQKAIVMREGDNEFRIYVSKEEGDKLIEELRSKLC